MSPDGDPEEPEVEVVEEPETGRETFYKVVRAPRSPTQADIDAHVATHLLHEEWCDVCMKGRGRNSPHRRREGSGQGGRKEDEHGGPADLGNKGVRVPRVSMDYFYTYTTRESKKVGVDAMRTQAIRDNLKPLGRSHQGSRQVVIKKYEDHLSRR